MRQGASSRSFGYAQDGLLATSFFRFVIRRASQVRTTTRRHLHKHESAFETLLEREDRLARPQALVVDEDLEVVGIRRNFLARALEGFVGFAEAAAHDLDEAPEQLGGDDRLGADQAEELVSPHHQ